MSAGNNTLKRGGAGNCTSWGLWLTEEYASSSCPVVPAMSKILPWVICWLCTVLFFCWSLPPMQSDDVLMSAATALCTCQTDHAFFWKRVSFLAFHIYHTVVKINLTCSSVVYWLINSDRVSCTPSCSVGKVDVHKEGCAENHTALAKGQWKNKWASVSSALQVEHSFCEFSYSNPSC